MKSFKLLLLLGLLTVTGCKTEDNQTNTNNEQTPSSTQVTGKEENNNNTETTTPDNSSNRDENTSSDNNEENTTEDTPNNDEENTNTNNENSENENTENSNTEENNENNGENTPTENQPINTDEEVSYKINLYNPTCGTFSKEALDTRLKEYINEEAKIDLVSSIKGSNCQLGANFPTKGHNVLIVGAASSVGSLEFTFTKTVKKFSITAQTYHKPYSQGGVDYPNVDANSALTIFTDGASPVFNLDLRSVEDTPVEKTMDIAINNTTLTLSSVTDSKGRVFIKEITFVL